MINCGDWIKKAIQLKKNKVIVKPIVKPIKKEPTLLTRFTEDGTKLSSNLVQQKWPSKTSLPTFKDTTAFDISRRDKFIDILGG